MGQKATYGTNQNLKYSVTLSDNGRSERIRTSDPLFPKQVRYQAAPRSDLKRIGLIHDAKTNSKQIY